MIVGWACVAWTIRRVGIRNLIGAIRNPRVPLYLKVGIVACLVIELGPLDDLILAYVLRRVGAIHLNTQGATA